MSLYSIGLDIGGTSVKITIVHQEEKVYQNTLHNAPGQKNMETTFQEILETIPASFLEQDPFFGIAVPGLIHDQTILASPNLQQWCQSRPADFLRQHHFHSCIIENDANVNIWYEYFHHCWTGSAAGITLGTGIGGAIILNGKLFTGHAGFAGEIGHHILAMENGHPCGCGQKGCFEAHASATALERAFAQQTGIRLESKEIFAQAKTGNHAAMTAIDALLDVLAVGVSNILNIINPRHFIISGGVASGVELFQPLFWAKLQAVVPAPILAETELHFSHAGRYTGAIGAAHLQFMERI